MVTKNIQFDFVVMADLAGASVGTIKNAMADIKRKATAAHPGFGWFTGDKSGGDAPKAAPAKAPAAKGTRGRKRKACDSCARGRVACDGDSPCETCLSKGLDCLYTCARQLQATGQGSDHEISNLHQSSHPDYNLGAHQASQRRISISSLL